MSPLLLPFTPRFITLTLSALAVLAFAIGLLFDVNSFLLHLGLYVAIFLTAVGIHDLVQKRHSILRNYPIAAHLRFIFEEIRPEMRQYFFEGEKDGTPFSRDRRAVVYQRAKMVLDVRPFGTQYDVYGDGYEWMSHSIVPAPVRDDHFRITIGGPDCAHPYSASVFNISAMSSAASPTIPGKAATAPIIAKAAATSSGRSARAISARAIRTAPSRPRSSPRRPPTSRSRWSS
jgi:glutamate synthase domain-containing protein 2